MSSQLPCRTARFYHTFIALPLITALSACAAPQDKSPDTKPPAEVANPMASFAGMVAVPGGEYRMGDHFNEGNANELPVHAVNVSTFYIDIYEVTNQQYADALNWAFKQGGLIVVTGGIVEEAGGNGDDYCATSTAGPGSRVTWDGVRFGVVAGKENHPMVDVTWYGAAAYSNWRSGMKGLQPSYSTSTWVCSFAAGGYRLPTEAEWEKAARGGLHDPYRVYPWGDTINGSNANYFGSGDPFEAGANSDTTPVGYYNGRQIPAGPDMANGYGLYDAAGNVVEWTNDWYGSTYYSASPYDNPQGPASGTFRVLRGGPWSGAGTRLRCAGRTYSTSDTRLGNLGFRLARE